MILLEKTRGNWLDSVFNDFGCGNGASEGGGIGSQIENMVRLEMGSGIGANRKGNRVTGFAPITFEHLVTNAALQITWRNKCLT